MKNLKFMNDVWLPGRNFSLFKRIQKEAKVHRAVEPMIMMMKEYHVNEEPKGVPLKIPSLTC